MSRVFLFPLAVTTLRVTDGGVGMDLNGKEKGNLAIIPKVITIGVRQSEYFGCLLERL